MAEQNDVRDHSRQFAMVPHDVIEAVDDARALALYCVLKRYANGRTGQAHPSRSRLAKHLGYKTTRPVDEALDVLKGHGLVRTFPRFRDDAGNIAYKQDDEFKQQTSNGYELYDHPLEKDVPLWPEGHTPHSPQATPPMAPGPHELDPRELNPRNNTSPGETPGKKKSDRGHRLPEGWQPKPEVWSKMTAEFPHVDHHLELEKFTDYWNSKPGAGGRKSDWNATWRNWIRNARSAPVSKPRESPAEMYSRLTGTPSTPTFDDPNVIDAEPDNALISMEDYLNGKH